MNEINITLENLSSAAREFLIQNKNKRKFAFQGQMGAGKTTFITALCEELGVIDLVSSPTFSIINEYSTNNSDRIFHFDFYRINTTDELYDIGFEEYCYTNDWCFIEWPEKGVGIIPEDFLFVTIKVGDSGERKLNFSI
jgi:tRNA threonylcarbamoyladenosine biosynthesis protein TsaE